MGLEAAIGGAFGAIPGALAGLFGGGRSAAEEIERAQREAIAERQREFGRAQEFLSPFQQAGVGAIGGLQGLIGQMQDPLANLQQIQAGFQQTPAQQAQMQQALGAIRSRAGALGLAGSGAERQGLTQSIANILGGQQQQFLQNVLGIRGEQEQLLSNLLGTGAGAAGQLAGGALQTGAGIAGELGTIGAARGADVLRRQQMLASLLGSGAGAAFGPGETGISPFTQATTGGRPWLYPGIEQFGQALGAFAGGL